jgi:hypothetical protein
MMLPIVYVSFSSVPLIDLGDRITTGLGPKADDQTYSARRPLRANSCHFAFEEQRARAPTSLDS